MHQRKTRLLSRDSVKPFMYFAIVGLIAIGMLPSCGQSSDASSDGPDGNGSNVIALVSAPANPNALEALAQVRLSNGQDLTLIGEETADEIEFRGISAKRADGGKWVYLTDPDDAGALFYGVSESGVKESKVLKFDIPDTSTIAITALDYDWTDGESVVVASADFDVPETKSSAYLMTKARSIIEDTTDTTDVERSLWDAFRTAIDRKAHFVVYYVHALVDKINEELDLTTWDTVLQGFQTSSEAITALETAHAKGDFEPATVLTEQQSQELTQTAESETSMADGSSLTSRKSVFLQVVSGGDQDGFAGARLDAPVVISVTDDEGAAIVGKTITVKQEDETRTDLVTDESGRITFPWTLGAYVGDQKLTIYYSDILGASGRTIIMVKALAIGDGDYMSCTINGVKVRYDPGVNPNRCMLNKYPRPGDTVFRYEFRYPLAFDNMTIVDNNYTAKLWIIVPNLGEGSYSTPNQWAPMVEVDPSNGLKGLTGLNGDPYTYYYQSSHPATETVSITVHEDATKYWGDFSASMKDNADGAVMNVTNGKFVKMK